MNVTEYLQEETRNLPTRIETNHFFSAVDNVRTDSDRLEARVQRLLLKRHKLRRLSRFQPASP